MNPLATNHPISDFKKHEVDGNLDLSPSFQRKPVWTDAQASYLIDSILNDLPVPEIFVRLSSDQDGNSLYEVVDGQQRLRSIIRFYQNQLILTGDSVSPRWLGKTWSDLESDTKTSFWQYKLVVRELQNASDIEVRDMFRRLNANQSNLNEQELRHSQYSGDFISAVEDLAADRWWLENRVVTPMQIRRMNDVEFISELLVGFMSGPLNKKNGLDDYYADYDEEFPDREHWVDYLRQVRGFTKAVVGGDLKGWNTKTEFYSLFLAVGDLVYSGDYPRSRAKLKRASDRLAELRSQVPKAKRSGAKSSLPDYVVEYADAVARASTDVSRRKLRISIISALIIGEQPPSSINDIA